MPTKGYNTKFEYGDQATHTGSTTWTEFAQIKDIKPPKVEADDIDISHMQSPDMFREYSAGWADGGELEVQVQFSKTDNATVYGLFRQDKGFRMTFADGSRWKLNGYIKTFSNELEKDGIVTATIGVKVSGKPVFEATGA